MRKQRNVGALNKSRIYDHAERIIHTYALIEKELLKEDVKLVRRYDESMITQSLVKSTHHKNLQIILNLSRLLGKFWEPSTKEDTHKLVVRIVEEYADDSGQETNTSYDHKKILKMCW